MKITKTQLRQIIKEVISEDQGFGALEAAARQLIEDANKHIWNTGHKPTDPYRRRYVEESDKSDEVKKEALRIIGWHTELR